MSESEPPTDLLPTLAGAGIACPPVGVPLPEIRTYGAWHWGTAKLDPFELYMFDVELVTRRLVDHGPFFTLCHAGHGVNSYGLNLVTSAGPVAAFVQHHFGGVYSDPLAQLIEVNSTYARLHILLGATAKVAQPLRWLMLWSNFRGVCGVVDLDAVRAGIPWSEAFSPAASEGALFESVAAMFRDSLAELDRIDWLRDPR